MQIIGRYLFVFLFLFFSIGAAFAEEEITVLHDVPYLGEEREEKLDAYLPSKEFDRPVPAVVLIHGGGWGGGDKRARREINIGTTLAENGFAVFSISYKLNSLREDGTREVVWPQNIYDCKSAVRFLRAHADEYSIDPDRIATMGGSAGGHLAMLVGTTAHVDELNRGGLYLDQSNEVTCVINFYGRHELSDRRSHFAGRTEEETDEIVRLASPDTWLNADTPPMLVVQGTKDRSVPPRITRALVRRLEELGVEHEHIEIEGAGHSFHLQPKQLDLRPAVLAFLKKHLGEPVKVSAAD